MTPGGLGHENIVDTISAGSYCFVISLMGNTVGLGSSSPPGEKDVLFDCTN